MTWQRRHYVRNGKVWRPPCLTPTCPCYAAPDSLFCAAHRPHPPIPAYQLTAVHVDPIVQSLPFEETP